MHGEAQHYTCLFGLARLTRLTLTYVTVPYCSAQALGSSVVAAMDDVDLAGLDCLLHVE